MMCERLGSGPSSAAVGIAATAVGLTRLLSVQRFYILIRVISATRHKLREQINCEGLGNGPSLAAAEATTAPGTAAAAATAATAEAGTAAAGTAAAATAAVEIAAVGIAAVGVAPVGTAAVGVAAVGSAAIGTAAGTLTVTAARATRLLRVQMVCERLGSGPTSAVVRIVADTAATTIGVTRLLSIQFLYVPFTVGTNKYK
jgi:hypothetical protein